MNRAEIDGRRLHERKRNDGLSYEDRIQPDANLEWCTLQRSRWMNGNLKVLVFELP